MVSSITKNHVLLHLAPQLPIAYSPTLQTRRIIANMLLMIFMTGIIVFQAALPKLTVTAG